jgi:hypothetical protein
MGISIPFDPINTGGFDFSPDPPKNKKLDAMRREPREDIPDLLEWTIRKRKFLGPGRPFNVDKHLYLVDIYRCMAKEIVLMKASQLGASEWLVSYAAHACDQRNGNVFYVFPTTGHVSDFSTARLGPAIEASPYLSKIVVDGSGAGGFKGSDRITLKRIRDRFLYFRGSQVGSSGEAPQLKSVDADVLILDEVDELDNRAPAIARKRLGHAREDLGNILWVSTPTYPGIGIHAEYLDSDQRKWFVPCPHCGEKNLLEIGQVVLEWDDLGRPVAWNGQSEGRAWVACVDCGGELDRLAQGEWVVTNPDGNKVGFHITKLFSSTTPLLNIVHALDTVDETKRKEAYNQDLGLPYTPRGGSLDAERIDACRRDYAHGPDLRRTCYMGVDIGRVLHVVVRTLPDFETGETKQLYAGETSWDHLPLLIKIYRPKTIVVDALPETTKARDLQAAYPRNMVWLAYYPNFALGSKKEEKMDWNPRERHVLLDRTRVLDEVLAGFYGMKSTLPAHARNIRDYYDHLRASVRVLKESNDGTEVARYVETGADHFLHAEAYVLAASQCVYGQGWAQGAAA